MADPALTTKDDGAADTGAGGGAAHGGNAAGGGAGAGAGGAAGGGAAGSGEGKSWLDGLPEELRDNPTLKRYATAEDSARALISAAGRLGAPPEELIRLPKPDDQAGMEKLWNSVGRPDKVDGYGDIKLPEGSPMDKEALQGFLASMHKAGPFTKSQAEAAAKWYGDFGAAQVKAATDSFAAAQAEGKRALQGEWGAAYPQKVDAAASAALRFGGADLQKFVNESGMGDDPRFLKAWAAVADALGEAAAAPHERGRDGGRGGALSPEEASAELAKMVGDEKINTALMDPNHAQHEHFVQRRLELIRLKNAGSKGA